MKTLCSFVSVLAGTIFVLPNLAQAQLNIPSDGSDRELIVTTNTVIDLSQAVTGVWSNASANPGKGIYDPNKWAVVFKYSSVFIASNTTVTFKNHGSRAPVVWLVSGDVTNNGAISLNSQPGGAISYDNVNLLEPGPGGFRGGARPTTNLDRGPGFGPGGEGEVDSYRHGTYFSGNPSLIYGNSQIVPLIGGSGGGAWAGDGGVNGGAGGGAILVAAAGNLTIGDGGRITANADNNHAGYWGSGGAVRLVANQILGGGLVQAASASGNPGRIRLEANLASPALNLNPPSAAVPPVPLIIWPAANAPTVRIVSLDGQAAPLDPRANISANGDDLTISTASTNTIVLQTANFPTNGIVKVFIKPRNGRQSILQATVVSGDLSLATWQVRTVLPVSHTIIQARAAAE